MGLVRLTRATPLQRSVRKMCLDAMLKQQGHQQQGLKQQGLQAMLSMHSSAGGAEVCCSLQPRVLNLSAQAVLLSAVIG